PDAAVFKVRKARKFATPATAGPVSGPPFRLASPGFVASASFTMPVKSDATLPNGSSAAMARPNGAPAVIVLGAGIDTTNWVAAAGLTAIEPVATAGRLPPVNPSATDPARLPARSVNVATPPETLAVTVPRSGPTPLFSIAVTTGLLSPPSTLPY